MWFTHGLLSSFNHTLDLEYVPQSDKAIATPFIPHKAVGASRSHAFLDVFNRPSLSPPPTQMCLEEADLLRSYDEFLFTSHCPGNTLETSSFRSSNNIHGNSNIDDRTPSTPTSTTHTNEAGNMPQATPRIRKHRCGIQGCGYTCAYPKDLLKHMNSVKHKGDSAPREHTCPNEGCSRRFTRAYSRKRHTRKCLYRRHNDE